MWKLPIEVPVVELVHGRKIAKPFAPLGNSKIVTSDPIPSMVREASCCAEHDVSGTETDTDAGSEDIPAGKRSLSELVAAHFKAAFMFARVPTGPHSRTSAPVVGKWAFQQP
jgi:hypothetical protein